MSAQQQPKAKKYVLIDKVHELFEKWIDDPKNLRKLKRAILEDGNSPHKNRHMVDDGSRIVPVLCEGCGCMFFVQNDYEHRVLGAPLPSRCSVCREITK